jgi:hypothetical protein
MEPRKSRAEIPPGTLEMLILKTGILRAADDPAKGQATRD